MREKIVKLIREAKLMRVGDKIIENLSDSIRIHCSVVKDTDLGIGLSKFGGCPELPPHMNWPVNNLGIPLAFLAQFNLNEVAQYDNEAVLPRTGMLYFFYEADGQVWGFDPEDRGNWKVFYYDGNDELTRLDPPIELPDGCIFEPCVLSYSKEVTLPPWESIIIDSLQLTEKESDLYFGLTESVSELDDNSEPVSRLLGHPDQVQGEMQLECQLVSNGLYCGDSSGYEDTRSSELKKGADNWRLLFQLDSVEDSGMMWGDLGKLYFWIKRDDLKERRFDNVWMVLQCG